LWRWIVLVAWLQLSRVGRGVVGDISRQAIPDDARQPPSSSADTVQVREGWRGEETERWRSEFHENWTPQALRQVLRDHLHSAQVIHRVESRNPICHNFDADKNRPC